MTNEHLSAMQAGRARASAQRRTSSIELVHAFRAWLKDESRAYQTCKALEHDDPQRPVAYRAWVEVLKAIPAIPTDSDWSDAA